MINFFKLLFGGKGAAQSIVDVAEVFRPNAEADAQRASTTRSEALSQFGAEFSGGGVFDSLVDALNRLPRPIMAFGTIGLMVFAMWDPLAFGDRMRGLDYVPEPLWWLWGSVVAFYFGARELHHVRGKGRVSVEIPPDVRADLEGPHETPEGRDVSLGGAGENPALAELLSRRAAQ